MFTILISYTTGNSFNTYDTEENISVAWKDKTLARKALKEIKAHYDYYTLKDKYGISPRERSLIECKAKNETWYSTEYPDYNINLLLDDGSYCAVNTFWCGYFEQLNAAEIVIESGTEENEDKFTI